MEPIVFKIIVDQEAQKEAAFGGLGGRLKSMFGGLSNRVDDTMGNLGGLDNQAAAPFGNIGSRVSGGRFDMNLPPSMMGKESAVFG